MVGAVFFLLLFRYCCIFFVSTLLTCSLNCYFSFFFILLLKIYTTGGRLVEYLFYLFFRVLIHDREQNHLIHYESRSGIGKWQLQDRRGFLRSQPDWAQKGSTNYIASQLDANSIRLTTPAVLVIGCILEIL
jgi:hypothetical protein